MKVVALIPAFNEEKTIGATLKAVASLPSLGEIVVINDGSTDRTGEIIQQLALHNSRLIALNLDRNYGKGAALNRGLEAICADIYLLLDGDLANTASLAQDLLEPVLTGQADMTIARFSSQQSQSPSGMGFGLVRRLATLGVHLFTGKRVTSPLSGQRAITAVVLETIGPLFEGFGVEIGLTVGALYHGFRVLEVPVSMQHRGYGRGLKGIRHRIRQLVHVIKAFRVCEQRGWY